MTQIQFQQGPIRPPSEADSLLIRTTQGCPWNRCSFCTLFRGMAFSIRPIDDIKQDIWAAREFYKGRVFESCFLQDGDSFAMQTEDLLEVLKTLKEAFLATADRFLSLDVNDQQNFTLGRRIHYYNRLDDMHNQIYYDSVQNELNRFMQSSTGDIEDIFYQLRQRMI